VVEDQNRDCIIISAIYSPPKHIIKKEQYINFFKILDNRFITVGDYNAKHRHWGLRLILPNGCKLLKAIEAMNLATILSTGKPTYWPSDNKKTLDLLDFGIMGGIAENCYLTEFCLELSSDHSPVSLL